MKTRVLYSPEKNHMVLMTENDVVLLPQEVTVDKNLSIYVYTVAPSSYSIKSYELVDVIEE